MASYQNKPLVSVCIPTYNKARYLRKSLESIINQTYGNLEIVVSDNASTDNTEEIMKSFTDGRLKYCRNPTNIGCYNNYNTCLKVAKGEFVAFYHSDDMYESDIVEKEVEFLQNHIDVAAVFTLDRLINENDKVIGKTNIPKELRGRDIYTFEEIFNAFLKYGNSFLICPTFMVKRDVFEIVGLFREDTFNTAADGEMWLRIGEKYPVGILKQTLIKRRIGRAQETYKYRCLRIERHDFFSVMDYYLTTIASKNLVITNSIVQCYEFQRTWDNILCATNLLMQGKQSEARKSLRKLFSWVTFITGFKSLRGIGKLFIGIVLYIGINMGSTRSLGNILYRIQYKLTGNL